MATITSMKVRSVRLSSRSSSRFSLRVTFRMLTSTWVTPIENKVLKQSRAFDTETQSFDHPHAFCNLGTALKDHSSRSDRRSTALLRFCVSLTSSLSRSDQTILVRFFISLYASSSSLTSRNFGCTDPTFVENVCT